LSGKVICLNSTKNVQLLPVDASTPRHSVKTKKNRKSPTKKRSNQIVPSTVPSISTIPTSISTKTPKNPPQSLKSSQNLNQVTPPSTKPLYNVRNSLNSDRFKPASQINSRNKKKPLQKLPRNRNTRAGGANNAASSTRSAQDLYGRRFSQEVVDTSFRTQKRVKSGGGVPTQTGHPAPLTRMHRSPPKYVLPKKYQSSPHSQNTGTTNIPTPSSLIESLAKTQNTTPQVVRKISSNNRNWSTSKLQQSSLQSSFNNSNQLVSISNKKSNSKVNVAQVSRSKTIRPETSPDKVSRSFDSPNRYENGLSSRYDSPNRFNNSSRFENSLLQISGTKHTPARPITRATGISSLEQLRQLDTSSPTLGFSKGRYQRLEKAVQSKLLERFHEKASESSKSNNHIHQLNNLKSDDSMRSVIQEVIQKHVEMGDNNNGENEKSSRINEQINEQNQPKSKARITNRMIVSRQQGKRQSLNTLVQEQIKLNCMQSENVENEDKKDLNFEIIGENQTPIYSAYTQKLLQDTPRTEIFENTLTPRLEINQIFDGRYDKYDNNQKIHDNSKHDKYDKLRKGHDNSNSKLENYRYDSKKCDDKKYDKYNSNSISNSNTNLNNNTKTIYTTQNYRIIQKSDGSYAYKLPNKPCEEFKSYKNRDAKDIARYVKKLKKRLTTAAAKGSVMSLSKHESDLRLSRKKHA